MDFGEENGMLIVGHTLVWYSQLSDYVKEITGREEMLLALKTHIDAVAGRYAGSIDAWDVVNEALNDDGSLRESPFYRVLGEDYLTEAYKTAAAAGPETKLYYHDCDMWRTGKREGAIRMITKIRESGGRVDGIGMQAHYYSTGPSIDTIEQSIAAYVAAGLTVMITELDVSVLPSPWHLAGAEVSQQFENSGEMNPFPAVLPASMQTVLADRYEQLFRLYLKHAAKIDRVTFWGVNDGHSWLNNWPIRNRTNHPLLFDREYLKKPAYRRIMGLKTIGAGAGSAERDH